MDRVSHRYLPSPPAEPQSPDDGRSSALRDGLARVDPKRKSLIESTIEWAIGELMSPLGDNDDYREQVAHKACDAVRELWRAAGQEGEPPDEFYPAPLRAQLRAHRERTGPRLDPAATCGRPGHRPPSADEPLGSPGWATCRECQDLSHTIQDIADPGDKLPYTLGSAIAQECPEHVIARIGARRRTGLLVGGPKDGKTTMACGMAHAVLTGRPWCGLDTARGRVVYVLARRGDGRAADIMATLRALGPFDEQRVAIIPPARSREQAQGHPLARVLTTLQAITHEEWEGHGADLVILDLLGGFAAGGAHDANEYGAYEQEAEWAAEIAEQLNAHVLTLHHSAKASDSRSAAEASLGSQSIAGAYDVCLRLTANKDKRESTLTAEGRGVAGKWRLSFDPVTGAFTLADPLQQAMKPRTDTEREILRRLAEIDTLPKDRRKRERSAAAIGRAIQAAARTVRDALGRLAGEKLARQNGGVWHITDAGRRDLEEPQTPVASAL